MTRSARTKADGLPAVDFGGNYFLDAGQGTAYSEPIEKALRISPQYAPALKGEVQILYDQGDNRAIPRILKEGPRDQTAHEMLALLERTTDRCDPAVVHFAASQDATETTPSLEAYGSCLVQLEEVSGCHSGIRKAHRASSESCVPEVFSHCPGGE
jgi:hypothetical protein